MQLGSFIMRKEGGDIGIVTDISDVEIRFIIVKGRWAYETGAISWCRTEVFTERYDVIAE